MINILTRHNPSIYFVVTTSTKSNPIINIYSKVGIFTVWFYMMSNKRFLFVAVLTKMFVSCKNFVSPLYISPGVAPFFIIKNYRLATFRMFSFLNIIDSSFIRTQLRTKPTFASKIRILVEKFITSFTVFSFTLFGHQSEYSKYKGVTQ